MQTPTATQPTPSQPGFKVHEGSDYYSRFSSLYLNSTDSLVVIADFARVTAQVMGDKHSSSIYCTPAQARLLAAELLASADAADCTAAGVPA